MPQLAALPQVRTMTDDALKYEALGSLPIWSVAQQWAHHCRVPTPALLGAVLAVVSARQSPSLMLTGPPAESPVSLHVTVLGGSGSGKSAALSAAHRALYLPDGETVWSHTCQPSSAEGLIDWLNATEDDADGEPQRVNTRGLVLADELAIFTGRAARQGNPLAPTLRSAWSGHELRADVSRHTNGRRQPVQRGTYQVSMLTFGTWGDAADLAADATGTAARMLWLHATDAQQPDSQPPEPTQRIAPHDWLAALSVHRDTFGRALPITLAAPVAAELDAALVARARGEEVPAAGHEHDGLLRLRIAAILGILSTATPEVTETLWEAAGALMCWRSATLDRVHDHATQAADAKARGRGRTEDVIDETKGERRQQRAETLLLRAATSLAKHCRRHGSINKSRDAANALSSLIRRQWRDIGGTPSSLVNDALALAGERDWITNPTPGQWLPGDTPPPP